MRLNPAIRIDEIPGLTPIERAIGRALQKYGAYCVDAGGARMALIAQVPTNSADLAVYRKAGLHGDYYGLPHLRLDDFVLLADPAAG